MRGSRAVITGMAAGLALAACTSPASYEGGAPQAGVLQVVDYSGTPSSNPDSTVRWSVDPDADVLVASRTLEAPDTVAAGQAFQAVTHTIGLDGCWRASGQTWRVRERVVEITPMDTHSGANICTEIVLFLKHTSTITIAEPGEWQLRVAGRRVRQGDRTWEEPVTAEKTLIVR
jgi:hypothetical protein